VYSINLQDFKAEYQTTLLGHTNSIWDFSFYEGLLASCA